MILPEMISLALTLCERIFRRDDQARKASGPFSFGQPFEEKGTA
jgi:hypothetical protein